MYETQDIFKDIIDLRLRRKKWEALYAKYEQRGQQNPATCYFREVNYKMLAKPLSLKRHKRKRATIYQPKSNNPNTDTFRNVDASDIIDSDNDMFSDNKQNYDENFNSDKTEVLSEAADSGLDVSSCYDFSEEEIAATGTTISTTDTCKSDIMENTDKIYNLSDQSQCHDCYEDEVDSTPNKLYDLKCFIEEDLKSDLKTMLSNRSVAKLLESKDYNSWHKCAKKEVKRLTKHISRRDLQEYMRHCNKERNLESVDINLIHDIIALRMHSNLKELFIKREFSRNNESRYVKYNERIVVEWKRLAKIMPVEYLLLYGTSVLHSINQIKERTSHSTQDQGN